MLQKAETPLNYRLNSSERSGWATKDIWDGLRMWRIWGRMGWNDIAFRYSRSKLGPFWSTLNLAITIAAIGAVFSQLWQIDIEVLMPYMCPGMILWALLSGLVNDGCMAFSSSGQLIRSVNLPLSIHVYRVVMRNFVLALHNCVVFIVVFFSFDMQITWSTFLVFPAIVLYVLNAVWVVMFLAVLCIRFRDVPQIVSNLIQLFFFITPIFWFPDALGRAKFISDFNVFTHFIDIGRLPLMGVEPVIGSWIIVCVVTVLGWTLSYPFYSKYYRRTASWL